MDSNFKVLIALMLILSLLYRLAFNDSIASNFDLPPGYSAPKSIAQIENEERLAFKQALAVANEPKKVLVLEDRKKLMFPNKKYLVLLNYKAKRKPVRKLN